MIKQLEKSNKNERNPFNLKGFVKEMDGLVIFCVTEDPSTYYERCEVAYDCAQRGNACVIKSFENQNCYELWYQYAPPKYVFDVVERLYRIMGGDLKVTRKVYTSREVMCSYMVFNKQHLRFFEG